MMNVLGSRFHLSKRLRLLLVTLLGMLLLPVGSTTASEIVDPNWAPPRTVYVAESGQALDQMFLDLWRSGGGAYAYGYPISPEITLANGHIVQYLQYARFEYLPEGDANGIFAKVADIGRDFAPIRLEGQKDLGSGRWGGARLRESELERIERAWQPLPKQEASRPNTAYWRYVPETGHSVQNGFKQYWEASGEVWYLGNPLSEEYVEKGTTYQVFERGQLAWKLGGDVELVPVGEVLADRYNIDTTPRSQDGLPIYTEDLFVPRMINIPDSNAPSAPSGYGQSIVVSLSAQTLWAYEGQNVVMETAVSTGREGFETPLGFFYVNSKLPSQTMEGVLGGEYYNVPDVPDVMYFTDLGHAIHGTYWHSNFGTPMSHGCINVPMGTSGWLYSWAQVGTPVLIVE